MDLRHFDLALLPALDVLLRERNVTRAAARLCVSQQALSATLRRLRVHFGDELLIRVGRRLELTPLGQSLLEPVREALLAVQAAIETRPIFNPASVVANFRVAISDYAAIVMLPGLLAKLEQRAPGTRLIVTSVNGGSPQALAAGEIDLCLASSDPHLFAVKPVEGTLRSELLFDDDFVVIFDPAFLCPPAPLDRTAYRSLRHGIAVFEEGVKTIVERGWSEDGGAFNVAVMATSFSTLTLMLPGTSIAATIQRRLARALACQVGLSVMDCPLDLPRLEETILWHERFDRHPAHAFLREMFCAVAHDLRTQGA